MQFDRLRAFRWLSSYTDPKAHLWLQQGAQSQLDVGYLLGLTSSGGAAQPPPQLRLQLRAFSAHRRAMSGSLWRCSIIWEMGVPLLGTASSREVGTYPRV